MGDLEDAWRAHNHVFPDIYNVPGLTIELF